MNDESQFDYNKTKWPTKKSLRIWAFGSMVIAILSLMLCANVYFTNTFLKDGAVIDSETVEGMKGMIKAANNEIVPAMAVLLIINSFLLWACSRKFYPKSDK